MSFSIEPHEAWYVAVPKDADQRRRIMDIFKPIFENPKSLKIGQNIKYDILVLSNCGIQVKGELFDTMVAHYILQPELHHGMDYLAEVYLNYKTIHIEELIGPKGKNQKNMSQLNPPDNEDTILSLVEKVNSFEEKYPDLKPVASICVYPCYARIVSRSLEVEEVKTCCVAGGFPSAQTFPEVKIAETSLAIHDGAEEIDIVQNPGHILNGDYIPGVSPSDINVLLVLLNR